MSVSNPCPEERGRLPRAWRYMITAGGILLAIGLFYGEENWRGERAWERYKQESLARGQPIEASALVPRPVPDEQNFAMTPFLAPLFDYLPSTQQARETNAFAEVQDFAAEFTGAMNSIKSPKVARSNSWVTAQIDLVAWGRALHDSKATSPVNAKNESVNEAAERVLSALAIYDPVIEELRAASRRPYSRFNLRYENQDPAAVLLPHLALLKRLCQILQVRASAELAAGHSEQALNDLNLIFYLTDSVRDEPILISHLVRMAEIPIALQPLAEGLANHQWSDGQLATLEERLAQFNFCQGEQFALQGERAVFGARIIEYVRTSPNRYKALSGLGLAGGGGQEPEIDARALLLAAVPTGWFRFEQVNYCRIFDHCLLSGIDVPGRRIDRAACSQAQKQIEGLIGNKHGGLSLVRHHYFFTALLVPALSKTFQRTALAQSAVDLARVACALERYRLAQGHYPESLEALAPRFMTQVPNDVMTGKPLTYRQSGAEDYLLYSVGWNETDDGGTLAVRKNGGTPDPEQGDWVWRLPGPRGKGLLE